MRLSLAFFRDEDFHFDKLSDPHHLLLGIIQQQMMLFV
jgi:hypothetical protein